MIRIRSFGFAALFVTLLFTACKSEYPAYGTTAAFGAERPTIASTAGCPCSTADITDKLQPTQPAIPTIAKTPGVLDCADIVKAHKESTDLQWEGEKMRLRGSEIYYVGTVFAVTEHDEVHLTGSLCHATLHHVPHEISIQLTKGQYIEGYGTITSVGFNRGEDIDIEVNPDLLFVR
jgi:hypothetical protein